MLTQLSRQETKDLIQTSRRIENWDVLHKKNFWTRESENLEKMSSIVSWHHCLYPEWEGGYPNSKITCEKLTKVFGFEPNGQLITWCRYRAWGLNFDGIKFVVFNSIRGTSFQVDTEATDDQVQRLIDYLFQIMCNGKNLRDMYRKERIVENTENKNELI